MNTKRVIWSGLVTGLIIVLLDGVVNGVILASPVRRRLPGPGV